MAKQIYRKSLNVWDPKVQLFFKDYQDLMESTDGTNTIVRSIPGQRLHVKGDQWQTDCNTKQNFFVKKKKMWTNSTK